MVDTFMPAFDEGFGQDSSLRSPWKCEQISTSIQRERSATKHQLGHQLGSIWLSTQNAEVMLIWDPPGLTGLGSELQLELPYAFGRTTFFVQMQLHFILVTSGVSLVPREAALKSQIHQIETLVHFWLENIFGNKAVLFSDFMRSTNVKPNIKC
ncbi:unnamed protein product [Protopolystoma xenopodis]|uniref:Uncharacterized protein n=1 Tax=Protopolystoma xenopodis TaxID=117903 RepID=A0A448WDK3_9PLAT|nr:unnamed protein product [Protopolystoma xenopodis]